MAPVLGARTTALQALRDADLTGQTAVITGGNSGIGVETARALASAGAKVILTSRKAAAGEAVVASLKEAGVKGAFEVHQLDLADLGSVKSFANSLQHEPRIDLLMLNAGVLGVPLSYTKDNFELQVGTNHFGHFVLVQSLLDKLQQQGTPVRIVAVSSSLHAKPGFDIDDLNFRRRPYSRTTSYHQSKLCNILFIKELAKRLQGSNIQAFCLHPGVIPTALSRHLIPWPLTYLWKLVLYFLGKNVEQGAATSVYAATAPELNGKSGAYLADCKIATPSVQAQDAELAKKLWAVTEKQLQDPSART
ncbi:TPA: hypothetical protein ACH3X3_012673 [Trebouxia sp. C0006]